MAVADQTVVVSFVGDASGLAKAIDRVDRELGQLVRQTDRAQAALGSQLGKATASAAKGINQYSAAQNRMMKVSGRSRANMQNLGFQIQDIAVQLEMGTDAMRVFGQQGSQIAGIFGPGGAFLGALIAIGAATGPLIADMLQLDGALKGVGEAFKEAGRYALAYLKVITVPNVKAFIADVIFAWENIEIFKQAVIAAAGAFTVYFTPAIIRATAAVYAFMASNPVTAFLAAISAAAVAAVANWDKIRLFFAIALPASIDLAKGAFISLGGVILQVFIDAARWITDFVDNTLSKLVDALNVARDAVGARPLTAPSVGDGLLSGLEGTVKELQVEGGILLSLGGLGLQDYKAALAELNAQREVAIQAELDLGKAITETGEAGADTSKELTTLYEDLDKQVNDYLLKSIDSLIDGFAEGELAFKDFAKTFLRDIAKMILQASILYAIQSAMGVNNPVASPNLIGSLFGSINAKGNAFQNGTVVPFAKGGVVNGSTLFPMTGGTGLMGEAGPEAIMPLSRNSQGELGVSGPSITINNNAGVDVAVVRSDEEIIEIAVNRASKRVQAEYNQSMATGQGGYSRSLEQGYTSRRRAT